MRQKSTRGVVGLGDPRLAVCVTSPEEESTQSHGSVMSLATTAPRKPSSGTPWRAGNSVAGRGNAGWTTSKKDTSDHARTAHKGLLQKRLDEVLGLIAPHVSPTTQSGNELNSYLRGRVIE